MKHSPILILLLHLSAVLFGQSEVFDLEKIEFKGLHFFTEKEEIVKTFGEPKIVFPEYECGFHSVLQSGGPYYQLVYTDFNFIGSDTEKFQPEIINFDIKGNLKLHFNKHIFSGLTTMQDFIKIFGQKCKNQFLTDKNCEMIILLSVDRDDGAKFTFRYGKLIRFEYWSPC